MKARRTLPVLLTAALLSCTLLAACQTVEAPSEGPASSAPASSVSSLPESSLPVSSEAVSSEAESRPESATEPAVSQTAQSSDAVSSKAEPAPVASEPPPATSRETPPSSAEPAPPPVSSENIIPEGRRPMTEAEVDQVIQEAIEYADKKGFYVWQEKYSIDTNGYYLPANSTEGIEIFRRDLFYKIDYLYQIALEDYYWQEGMDIYYKIEKGPIEDEPNGWFAYVLY